MVGDTVLDTEAAEPAIGKVHLHPRKQNPQKGFRDLAIKNFHSSARLIIRNCSRPHEMHTHRFGRNLKLSSTIAIKHQIRKLMFEDLVKKAEAGAAEAIRGQLRKETRRPVQSG
jgi:hypothetical protein